MVFISWYSLCLMEICIYVYLGRQLGSYGGPIPPPEAADAESAQRRMCVSVFPSNRAKLWLLVASFSTPELVFPAGGAVCKQNNRL